ncbi:MAG: hypothetical protein R3F56_11360 [Planctomycetota bacterium]
MSTPSFDSRAPSFRQELHVQRWDDHRYYHQSRVNQTLHLVSALTFLSAYIVVFFDPAVAALLGWLVAMVTRQSGHFFFEPNGYDEVNDATHEYKESIKVGYNLHRKVILHAVWILSPMTLWFSPTLFGRLPEPVGFWGHLHHVGWIWFVLGVAAVSARALYLGLTQSWRTGIVWVAKILTDPFHDVAIYWRSPLALLRGEWLDPMHDVQAEQVASR